MLRTIEQILEHTSQDCFSDIEIANLFEKSNDHRYGLIKRAIAKNELIHLRRGLYCFAEKYRRKSLSLFAIAQKIYGPSYISFESALSHHGFIPEGVFAVTSACHKRSREFKTSVGVFNFVRVVCDPFLSGVRLENAEGDSFMMATPLKALTDYVYAYKKDWKGVHPLIHSLRIDETFLQQIKIEDMTEIEKAFKSKRVLKFLEGVRKDLNL